MNLSKKTKSLITKYRSLGYEILIGNDWRLSRRPKWSNHECVRLCQTNSRSHGKSLWTVWAVKEVS